MAKKIETVILGVGNTLLGDEGIGVHAVRRLAREKLPSSALLIDGSTAGFKLLALFEQYKGCRFIIIDALRAEGSQKKGSVYCIPLKDFYQVGQSGCSDPDFISFHQTAVTDVLKLFCLTRQSKIRGHFIGVNVMDAQQDHLDFSMTLSKEAQCALEKIVETVKKLL